MQAAFAPEFVWSPPHWVVSGGQRIRVPGAWSENDDLLLIEDDIDRVMKADIGEIAQDILSDKIFKELRQMQDRVDEARRKVRMYSVNVSKTKKGYGRRHTLAKINLKKILGARRKLWLEIAKKRAYLPLSTGLATILEGYGRSDVVLRAGTAMALAGGDATVAAARIAAGNAQRAAARTATNISRRTALAGRAVARNTQSFVNASRVWVKPYVRVVNSQRVLVPGFWRSIAAVFKDETTTGSLLAA